jgi:hypothetical protein
MVRALIVAVLVPFALLTAAAIWRVGYVGIFLAGLDNLGAGQIFFDLVIALSLVLVWMWRDARATGRNPWPWIFATLLGGSFGPLLYLLTRSKEPARALA